jgi:hypothetical protein
LFRDRLGCSAESCQVAAPEISPKGEWRRRWRIGPGGGDREEARSLRGRKSGDTSFHPGIRWRPTVIVALYQVKASRRRKGKSVNFFVFQMHQFLSHSLRGAFTGFRMVYVALPVCQVIHPRLRRIRCTIMRISRCAPAFMALETGLQEAEIGGPFRQGGAAHEENIRVSDGCQARRAKAKQVWAPR